MQFQSITIQNKDSGMRLDAFLSKKSKLSRANIQKLIKDGHVRLNNKEIKKNGLILAGSDKISYRIPGASKADLAAEDIPLKVLYEDENMLVINKEAGIVVHPDKTGHSSGTIVNAALHHAKDLSGIGGELRPGIVHRLDKDTSGVLLIAKNDKTHQDLAKRFKDRKVEKTYLALVHKTPKTKKGKIEAALKRSAKDRKKMSINETGKNAITTFEVLQSFPSSSLLKVKIETGRTHQIRVHLASIGHPVIGDKVYGSTKINKEFERNYSLNRQFLHASELKIKRKTFKAELPEDLESVLDDLSPPS